MKPTPLDLYRTHAAVKAMHDTLRAGAQEHGEWGAVRSLEQACYYLYGAFGWLIQDLSPEERDELEEALEQLDLP